MDQLADTLRFYTMKRPSLPVGEISPRWQRIFSGWRKGASPESSIGIKTMLWRPFDEMRDRLDQSISLLQPKLGVPLGLAIVVIYAPEKSLDLRREEFVPKTYFNLRKMFLFMRLGCSFFAVFLTVNVYQKAYYQERQYNWIHGPRFGRFLRTIFLMPLNYL